MSRFTSLCSVVLFVGISTTAEADLLHGPDPYLSFSGDSPFASTLAAGEFVYFHLEDFEDGLANTPGLILPPGSIALTTSNTFVDSVAEDNVDGEWGSFYTDETFTTQPFMFSFDAIVLGGLPTHAGIVVTDIQVLDGSFGGITSDVEVTVEAFGPGGVSLGSVTDPSFGNFNTVLDTGEDRFFGFFAAGGIESFGVSAVTPAGSILTMEFDHIQYGSVVPEPSSLLLACIGGLGLIGYVRRRRRHVA